MSNLDFFSVTKSSGNLDYGNECSSNNECDDNMICTKNLNDQKSRCRCSSGFNAIYSTSSGLFECGNLKFKHLK